VNPRLFVSRWLDWNEARLRIEIGIFPNEHAIGDQDGELRRETPARHARMPDPFPKRWIRGVGVRILASGTADLSAR
jgi:hypothetical protein